MGNTLFGIDIAGLIHANISPGLLPATLHHVIPGTRTSDLTAGTQPTETTHSARGIIDDYKEGQFKGDLILVGDRRVLLIGNSISPAQVPEPGDGVTIEGVRYKCIRVERDPAAATYTIQVRR
jgi:hypothetical protein